MNILITGAWKYEPSYLDAITELGHRVTVMPDERGDLPCDPDSVDGVICNGLFLYHPIEKFKNLRYIQLTSAGFDRVPIAYIKKHNFTINNARGVYSIPMAEFAVCGVLQLYKRSSFFYDNQKEHRWEKNREIIELCGKNVAVVGCGSVGTECAKRFSAFGCRVTGVDIFEREDSAFKKILPLEKLNCVLSETDIIVLTLPLTEESRHIVGKTAFENIKDGAVLVNIARGAVVDTDEMISALKSKKLSGAVLDVFEEEPLSSESPLWDMENVIITPHNSFIGDRNMERLAKCILSNLRKER